MIRLLLCLLLLSVLVPPAMAETSCVAEFDSFLHEFANDPQVQRQASSGRVLYSQLQGLQDNVYPLVRAMQGAQLALPLIAPVTADLKGLEVQRLTDGHVRVLDKRGGLDRLRGYQFERKACWTLVSVDDWSVDESRLLLTGLPKMNPAEEVCYRKANIFLALGGVEKYPPTAEFFDVGMQFLLCAAASGNPDASLAAASLGYSGMAPALSAEVTEKLFLAAAQTLPAGAAALYGFYCSGTDQSYEGPCMDPERARAWLIKSIDMGNWESLTTLASDWESGRLGGAIDLSRALACYELAREKGVVEYVDSVKRLQQAGAQPGGRCY
ncbi:sel1 repeat family protein [Pseudomonas putida]|uniref:sel1 repeat family protein n=1 Tax=Pseudomonas putida TaxID=303 RepID=UPI002366A13E|nr:sel1 repeat family protein [Pseudomonas putida]MDD2047122.1 sel1 repeat family protein [Pseudomonas putida]